ncbi:MAG: hypothetical protein HQK53_12395 [Oligoflexia bacterium]|nr:hypothetical protein [Oligoflexia bacterium]
MRDRFLLLLSLLSLLPLLSPLFCGAAFAATESVIQQRIKSLSSLHTLEKVTVGPDDSYQSVVSKKYNLLFFSKNVNMAVNIYQQDLKSGESTLALPPDGDSKDPAVSTDGEWLAFVYFKNDALGEICYKKIITAGSSSSSSSSSNSTAAPPVDIECIHRKNSEESLPQWVGNSKILFLTGQGKMMQSANPLQEIFVYDLPTKQLKSVLKERISSYSVTADGRLLAYVNQNQQITLVTLDQNFNVVKQIPLCLDLPGVIGFLHLSTENLDARTSHTSRTSLYWAQFINDTNHDQLIDGHDNGVIFRYTFSDTASDALAAISCPQKITPLALNSVETNCSYPYLNGDHLYLTCAFEGSLDIYRLPPSGEVPQHWKEKELLEALMVSRTYGERLLLYNHLAQLKNGDSHGQHIQQNQQLLHKIYVTHLQLKEYSSALFYGEKLKLLNQSKPKLHNFYSMMDILIQSLKEFELQPLSELTASFELFIEEQLQKLSTMPSSPLKKLSKAYLHMMLKGNSMATTQDSAAQDSAAQDSAGVLLAQIDYTTFEHSLELYYYLELAKILHAKNNNNNANNSSSIKLENYYLKMLTSKLLSEDEILYYAFTYATYMQEESTLTPQQRIENYRSLLARWKEGSALHYFFQAEIASLEVGILPAKSKEEKDAYSRLVKVINDNQKVYLLKRVIFVRAILNMVSGEKSVYQTFVATNWMRFTLRSEMEFKEARAQYTYCVLNNAYQYIAAGKDNYAMDNFYGALLLSDDLEAHFGHMVTLLKTMGEVKGMQEINDRYLNMRNRNHLGESVQYVSALQKIYEYKISHRILPKDTIKSAIYDLENMGAQEFSPMRYLLQGYLYYTLLMDKDLKFGGKEYSTYLQAANRALMLAYDLSRNNPRARASALDNLLLLHLQGKNYALASRFGGYRERIKFASKDEEVAFLWFYSRALFYSFDFNGAKEKMMRAVALDAVAPPLKEKLAFYAMYAGDYQKASNNYRELLQQGAASSGAAYSGAAGNLNSAKMRLALGYTYFKSKDLVPAERELLKALAEFNELISKSKSSDANEYHRQLMVIYGLLAEVAASDIAGGSEREIGYKVKRLELLEQLSRGKLDFKFSKDYLEQTVVKEYQKLAYLYYKRNQMDQAVFSMSKALSALEQLAPKISPLSATLFMSLKQYLLHASLNREHTIALAKKELKGVRFLVSRALDAYQKELLKTPDLLKQEEELKRLWKRFDEEFHPYVL